MVGWQSAGESGIYIRARHLGLVFNNGSLAQLSEFVSLAHMSQACHIHGLCG